MHLLLTLQGSAPVVAGWCKRDWPSCSLRLIIGGPRQRRDGFYVWVWTTLPQCVCAEGKVQEVVTGQEATPKRDQVGVTTYSQSNTCSFWPEAPWTALMGGERAIYWNYTLYSITIFKCYTSVKLVGIRTLKLVSIIELWKHIYGL